MNMFWRCLTLSFISVVVTGCETVPGNSGAGLSPDTDPLTAYDAEAAARTADGDNIDPAVQAMVDQAKRDAEALAKLQDPASTAQTRGIEWTDAGAQAPRAGVKSGEPPFEDLPPDNPPPVLPDEVDDTTSGAPPSAGAGFNAGGGDRLRGLLVELSRELYLHAGDSDMPLIELLAIAATTMVSSDRALSPDALPGLTDRERELLGIMQDFFIRVAAELDETGDPEALVTAVAELQRALTREPQLQLDSALLCRSVAGFADYEEFRRDSSNGPYRFLAGSGQGVVVYVEVDDFRSELNGNDEWVTELSQRLVIYNDRDGIPVWTEDWQAAVDITHQKRKDFFMVQLIEISPRLSVGRYQLKVTLRDEKSKAEAETAIEFELVADPRMSTSTPN